MAFTVEIAPGLERFSREKNIVSVDFNGMHLEYHMRKNYQPSEAIYKYLQAGIAMCSHTWQIEEGMNAAGIKGILTAEKI